MDTDETAIRHLLDERVRASQDKDLDRLMSHFDEDIVYYDGVAPLDFTGTDAVRANFQRWFDGYEGGITLGTKDLRVAVSGDVAFANMLHLDSGTRTDGAQSSIWVRSTVCCRKRDGRWLITHEHISLPIDPKTMGAWFAPVD